MEHVERTEQERMALVNPWPRGSMRWAHCEARRISWDRTRQHLASPEELAKHLH